MEKNKINLYYKLTIGFSIIPFLSFLWIWISLKAIGSPNKLQNALPDFLSLKYFGYLQLFLLFMAVAFAIRLMVAPKDTVTKIRGGFFFVLIMALIFYFLRFIFY